MKLTGDQVLTETSTNVVDSKGNLKLYHYTTCDDIAPESLKQVRGVILDSSNNNIVVRSFPYTNEFIGVETNLPFLNERRKNMYFHSNEGTIIRVFHYAGEWHVSTHRRIDAFQSRWGGPCSFGEFFQAAIETCLEKPFAEFLETLDKSHQYIFLLYSTPQTRIVSPSLPYPFVSLVATIIDGEFRFDNRIEGIHMQKQIEFDSTRTDIENITEYINACNSDKSKQGIFIVSTDTTSGDQYFYKIVSPVYHELSLLRGNAYDIPTRFLELRIQKSDKVNDFIQLFSEYTGLFMFMESRIDNLITHIFAKYRARFTHRQYAPVHPVLYPFMKSIMQQVNSSPEITRDVVCQCFARQPISYITKMLSVHF